MTLRFSIIVPVYNEGQGIVAFLESLQPLRNNGHQLIVIDGGSQDQSAELAKPLTDKVLTSEPSRAAQMNAGAKLAEGDVLIFLHADTSLPKGALALIEAALGRAEWGRFDVRLSGWQWQSTPLCL